MKKLIIICFTIICLTASFTIAEDAPISSNKNINDKDAEKRYNSAVLAFNNLELTVAYWQEAWQKGNKEQAKVREMEVEKIIWDDLFKALRNNSTDKTEVREDDSLFRVKRSLFKSFKKGETFGHKYRIVSDYRDMLKRQMLEDQQPLAEQSDKPTEK